MQLNDKFKAIKFNCNSTQYFILQFFPYHYPATRPIIKIIIYAIYFYASWRDFNLGKKYLIERINYEMCQDTFPLSNGCYKSRQTDRAVSTLCENKYAPQTFSSPRERLVGTHKWTLSRLFVQRCTNQTFHYLLVLCQLLASQFYTTWFHNI